MANTAKFIDCVGNTEEGDLYALMGKARAFYRRQRKGGHHTVCSLHGEGWRLPNAGFAIDVLASSNARPEGLAGHRLMKWAWHSGYLQIEEAN